jgi:peroxiredoxin
MINKLTEYCTISFFAFFVFWLIILFHPETHAQTLSLSFPDTNEKASLALITGEKLSFIDSLTFVNGKSSFTFDKKNQPHGLYRVTFSNHKAFDFLYAAEELDIEIAYMEKSLFPIEKKSNSNILFYTFREMNKSYKTKSELLQLIIVRYPADDDYFSVTKERLKNLQQEYLNFIYDNAIAMPNTLISEYLRSAQLPIIDLTVPPNEHLKYLRAHALDNVNFYDERLINSDLFANKSIEYLTYYRNPQLPLELLEKEFMSAVDTLLNKAKVNEEVYTHVTEYLLDGFKKFGFDNVINYILDNYVIKDDLCLDAKLSDALDRRIQQSKLLKVGTKAPEFTLFSSKGETITLKTGKSKKQLLVFYSTNCSHCKTMLPELRDLHSARKDFDVIAIALDTKKEEWVDFIKKNKLTWNDASDLKGWDGEAAQAYHIYATPTMFLLDESKTIISKPMSIDELKQGLDR